MATKSKRLPLTLDSELGALIAEIAELRQIKQTRVVTEILRKLNHNLWLFVMLCAQLRTMNL